LSRASPGEEAVVTLATPDVLEVQGRGSVQDLALAFDEHDGVLEVSAAQAD
jgi:hypothetical protein